MALVTIAEVKDFLKLDPNQTLEDAMLTHLINVATAEMERDHDRVLEYTTGRVEVHSGKAGCYLFLKAYPIETITEVLVDGVALSNTEYEVNKAQGILKGFWPRGMDNIQVTYNGGYWTDPGTQPPAGVQMLPFDLKHECLERVAYLYENRGGRR
jgi:uncharacterized phiE125 gp8 family phage protein